MTRASSIGKLLIISTWVVCATVVALVGGEWALQVRTGIRNRTPPVSLIRRLERAYGPFVTQYLHPQYLFFFPLDPAERAALSNEVVQLDEDGFRGQGPAFAGSRQLAFIVGGSAAFGHYASSDDTTITGYLNQIQDTYFFVNAGVPSWNSTQEMFRVAFQLAAYRPSLVIAYNGANDAGILDGFRDRYPAGTPESFEILASYFDNLRGSPKAPRMAWDDRFKRVFPEVHYRLNRFVRARLVPAPDAPAAPPMTPETRESGTTRFIENQRRMRDLVHAGGGRFIWIYQPVLSLHTPDDDLSDGESSQRSFHRAVLLRNVADLEFHDFSALFNRFPVRVALLEGEPDDSTIFIDEVHLFDPGNAIVARELWRVIREGT